MIRKISTLSHVKVFLKKVFDEGTCIHPDDDFADIVSIQSGQRVYKREDATIRNRLMKEAFVICSQTGQDIYDIAMVIYLKKTGLGKYITDSR